MVVAAHPRYRLTSHAVEHPVPCWQFFWEDLNAGRRFEASDCEPGAGHERLDLLALVRGLESIEGPSRLSLLTTSRYVHQGLVYGLNDWRENGWRWESFGLLVPIKNIDLWQRVDQALQYHQVEASEFCTLPKASVARESRRNQYGTLRVHRLDVRAVHPAWTSVSHVSLPAGV
jgi:hypothetical protein